MKPEEQITEIVLACPELFKLGNKTSIGTDIVWMRVGKHEADIGWIVVDVLSDLNVMHEVEKSLGTVGGWIEYILTLGSVCFLNVTWQKLIEVRDFEELAYRLSSTVSATASQRAEAFLKTIGKWK